MVYVFLSFVKYFKEKPIGYIFDSKISISKKCLFFVYLTRMKESHSQSNVFAVCTGNNYLTEPH